MSTKQQSRSSVFDAIEELDSQDVRANRKRKTSTTSQARQSKAARSQTTIHGHLMECRILLQRAMNNSTGDQSDSTSSVEACNQLLSQLLQARRRLLTTTPNDDEKDEMDYAQIVESESLPEVLAEEYDKHRDEWKRVLNRRHQDLKLHAGLTAKAQFRVLDSSFWQQVDNTVSHEELRQQQQSGVVFDDTKVYQHMLQDFLASSTSGGAEEAAAQRLRRANKTSQKKAVDRRASKGRKIRYVEMPKMVNFTFPVARPAPSTGMDEDEWFKSLFGGAANRKMSKP